MYFAYPSLFTILYIFQKLDGCLKMKEMRIREQLVTNENLLMKLTSSVIAMKVPLARRERALSRRVYTLNFVPYTLYPIAYTLSSLLSSESSCMYVIVLSNERLDAQNYVTRKLRFSPLFMLYSKVCVGLQTFQVALVAAEKSQRIVTPSKNKSLMDKVRDLMQVVKDIDKVSSVCMVGHSLALYFVTIYPSIFLSIHLSIYTP